jgi:dihydroorotase-like cyclic amidohydrolase
MYSLDSTLSRYRNQHISFGYDRAAASNEVIEFCVGLIDKYNIYGSMSNLMPNELKIIESARRVGNRIKTEISSSHLIRSNELHENEELFDIIRNGQIDFLVSCHSPNLIRENYHALRPSEVPGLDTYGGLITWLIKKRGIDPVRIFRMSCMLPGAWVSRFMDRKIGRLLQGYEANITVLNMNKSMVNSRCLYTKCKWSPFDLRQLPGSVESVYLKGIKVVDGIYMRNF